MTQTIFLVPVFAAINVDNRMITVVNIGSKPTFHEKYPLPEAHLIDFQQDIYDKELQLTFLKNS